MHARWCVNKIILNIAVGSCAELNGIYVQVPQKGPRMVHGWPTDTCAAEDYIVGIPGLNVSVVPHAWCMPTEECRLVTICDMADGSSDTHLLFPGCLWYSLNIGDSCLKQHYLFLIPRIRQI